MRAVNLIPADARRGGGAGAGGRSGGAVYVVLGALAILVVLVGTWALAGRSISRDQATLASLEQQAAALRAQAPRPAAGADVAALAGTRAAAVRTILAARQDWAGTLDALARALPSHTWISTLTAASSPTSAPAGGTGGGGAVASSSTGPSVQLSGCTPTPKTVATLLPRLRVVPGVERVSVVSVTRAESSGSSGAAEGECTGVSFQVVLFLAAPAAPVPGAPAATPAAGATAPGAPAPAAAPPAATPASGTPAEAAR